MISRNAIFTVLALVAGAVALGGGACNGSVPSDQGGASSSSSDSSSASSGASTSSSSSGGTGGAGTGDAGTGGASDCFMNPMTYLEIINACTNAQKVDVSPVLPLLESDGGLPALP